MFVGGIALLVNTVTIIALYFIGNIILAPIIDWAEKTNVTETGTIVPISDTTYIFPAIFGLLIIMEIVIIISFVVIIGRRNVVEEYAEY